MFLFKSQFSHKLQLLFFCFQLHLVPIKDGGIPLDDSSESPNLRDVFYFSANLFRYESQICSKLTNHLFLNFQVQNKDTSLRSSPRQSNQGSSCNTPTGGLSTTSRKLFDNVQTESPLDGLVCFNYFNCDASIMKIILKCFSFFIAVN